MKNFFIFILCILAVFLLTGCAESLTFEQAAKTTNLYGFWGGLWHGFITIGAWIGSLFSSDIAIYAINNNGGWYDFGYILGLGINGRLISIKL